MAASPETATMAACSKLSVAGLLTSLPSRAAAYSANAPWLPQVATHLDAARDDILAFTAFPKGIWRQIWSTNPVRHEAPRVRVEVEDLRRWAVAAA